MLPESWTPRARLVMAIFVGLLLLAMQIGAPETCPSTCSDLSPLPYPFGAKPGCGLPGFQLTDCSLPKPLWNIALAGTDHPYYIQSVGPGPNNTNPQADPILNYGYGGAVVLLLNYTVPSPAICEYRPIKVNNFTTSNFYAFEDADLVFYQDHYLFIDCEKSNDSGPESGIWTKSSPLCSKYLEYCKLNTSGVCFDYEPHKALELVWILTAFKCSFVRRYIIEDVNAPLSSWVPASQLAWGPVQHADSCKSCQLSGGECGYNVLDPSHFQCYCKDSTQSIDCHEKLDMRIRIAIGISSAFLFILICGAAAWYFHHKNICMFSNEHLRLDGIDQTSMEFRYGALEVATKSFSTMIGHGAFGKVYYGVLSDGNEVAVKVLDASMSHTDEVFMNEVATIGSIHHMNVARLVGYCFRRSNRSLVYEYVSKGSLDKYLFSSQRSLRTVVLSWKQRLDIALGVARGLHYMHEECRRPIIHCDIKPQNILLDDSFCAKISDFGLARLLTKQESRILTHARGTPGYVAPEFWSFGSGFLSTKFDVYSYGVVLLEIIQGKRCVDMLDLAFGEEDEQDVWMSVSVDKELEGEADEEQIKLCMLVAFWCIQGNPVLRPSMKQVVQYLEGSSKVPNNPPKPFKTMFQTKYAGPSTSYSLDSHVSPSSGVLLP